MDTAAVTNFLGWTLVLHIAVLLVMTVFVTVGRGFVMTLHTRLLGMEAAALQALYVKVVGEYKILILVFSAVPYLTLKLLGN